MANAKFYGAGFPYKKIKKLPGKLIVVEGTDGVGRSTQVDILKKHLEKHGFAVSDTGLRRSPLTERGLEQAKSGNTLNAITNSLFYATDFADRLENQIIPALRAGFLVLSDRYFYSIIARDVIRGIDPKWAREIYGFALVPDIIIYLKAEIDTLITRIVHGRGFDYWEAGMDIIKATNLYDSFREYQGRMIEQFDKMAEEFHFQTIDANGSIKTTNDLVMEKLKPILEEYNQ